MINQLAEHRATTVEYELYIAALHRPSRRPAATAWDAALAEIFGSRVGSLAGEMFAALFCGLVLQASLAEAQPTVARVAHLARRALDGPTG